MSKDNRFIVRRTISQERFEVLWKKRQEGVATLRDLTEMDEIINRDPSVRQFVLAEMEEAERHVDNNSKQEPPGEPSQLQPGLVSRIKTYVKQLFAKMAAVVHKREFSQPIEITFTPDKVGYHSK
jgi:hypothetical protein